MQNEKENDSPHAGWYSRSQPVAVEELPARTRIIRMMVKANRLELR